MQTNLEKKAGLGITHRGLTSVPITTIYQFYYQYLKQIDNVMWDNSHCLTSPNTTCVFRIKLK